MIRTVQVIHILYSNMVENCFRFVSIYQYLPSRNVHKSISDQLGKNDSKRNAYIKSCVLITHKEMQIKGELN